MFCNRILKIHFSIHLRLSLLISLFSSATPTILYVFSFPRACNMPHQSLHSCLITQMIYGEQYKSRCCKACALPTLKKTDFFSIMLFRAMRDVFCNRRLIIRNISVYIYNVYYIYKTLHIYIYKVRSSYRVFKYLNMWHMCLPLMGFGYLIF